ncbi:MAG: hypothetical protein IPJ02_13915 [Chitinophagaceae bacterium]|nr:hypothetical protein [Chitinophagaceae bacterium]
MGRKKWVWIILAFLLVFGYVKLFYKTWSENAVPASADCVIALDVKRVTNTLIWNFLTTPGQWKTGKLFQKKSRDTSWRDMVKLPDYILAFHSKGQPLNTWFVLLEIKSQTGFEAGLKKFGFEMINSNEYVSKPGGIYLLAQDEKILAGNIPVEDSNLIRQVAKELFKEKKFIARTELKKAIDAKSHLAVYMAANDLIRETGILTAGFDKEKIRINGAVIPRNQYSLEEERFIYPSGSLCVLGFTQPSPAVFDLLNKNNISKALSLDMDSVFVQSNTSYSLNLQNITERTDSAITYTYDDEFNKVEKRVVNRIQEPSFALYINGKDISSIYNYLQRNNKLESTASGDVFLPMPLVKSYCNKKTATSISITSSNYSSAHVDESIKAVLFFRLALTKIPKDLFRYLPDAMAGSLSNIAEIDLSVTRKNEQLQVNGTLTKMKNDLPLIKF